MAHLWQRLSQESESSKTDLHVESKEKNVYLKS